ncbi:MULTISPECIES: MFS transporter [unclassified Chelatococcus]|uniref:MFS transporter n=1 Tax=unclassified Chelatococcus TaxID=2638111 RepID=UPI001BCF3A28|nr:MULTISPECIES: MFS transporter [unclassified Chelatococcus]MBS7740094.1 MFS transporter [Chelatococcus sp. HY11]MBX3545077.1 MFS transporter [Chelatococcus sp.]MCO5078605.1 MFS transporter [Chelatococcus sp.]
MVDDKDMHAQDNDIARPHQQTAHRSADWAFKCYVLFSFLVMYLIGTGLIVISWVATEHGTVALVGQLYFTGGMVSIALSVIGGVLVDRHSRRTMILRSQSLRVIAAFILLAGLQDKTWLTFCLFSFTIISAAGPALSVGAMGGAFQSFFPSDRRMNVVLRLSIVGQVGFIFGTGTAGTILHIWGETACMLIFIATSIALLCLGEYFTRGMSLPPERKRRSFTDDWRDGLKYTFDSPHIGLPIIGVSLLFSVAQMTNTLVPGFVRETLHAGSDVFGVLEAAWSAGGGLVLLMSASLQRRAWKSGIEFLLLALLGAAMIGFALSKWVPLSFVLYAVMGGLFCLSRSLCNGRLLTLTDPAQIGRTQALSSMLTSTIGMTMYMLPTFVRTDDIGRYYQIWGVAIIVLGLCLAALSIRLSSRVHSRPGSVRTTRQGSASPTMRGR